MWSVPVAVALAALAAIVVAALAVRIARLRTRENAPPAPAAVHPAGDEITLDLDASDPGAPAVQRLAADAARRLLSAANPPGSVVVRDRAGQHLLRARGTADDYRVIALPEPLHEPHVPHSRAPSPVGHDVGARPPPKPWRAPERPVLGARSFVDRFVLPERARSLVEDGDEPAQVLRAVLMAGGRPARVDGDVVTTGETAIAFAHMSDDRSTALSTAVHRLQATGLARRVVIRLGYADPGDLRRRELADPALRITDVQAVQRMADAAALGADPLDFLV